MASDWCLFSTQLATAQVSSAVVAAIAWFGSFETTVEERINGAARRIRAFHACAELVETLPRFPKTKLQRDVAGRHYLTKTELNALYFATYQLARPRGWHQPFDIGRYWRSALVLYFNYGLDTGTVWKWKPVHQPILWRND